MTVSPVSDELGNTKPARLRSRAWTLTLFNYKEEDITLLSQQFTKYIIGEEICPTTNKQHLQCFLYNNHQVSFSSIKEKWPTAHIETAKGSIEDNLKYCSKEGNYITNIKKKRPLKTITDEQLYDWQKEILTICQGIPDDRTIYWYWEPVGNMGKSAFCKYMAVHHGAAVITTAKSADIATCIDEETEIYIFDFPRNSEGFSPWNGIEQLKNGLITEAKLKKKAKTTIINCPHVIIFANWVPDNIPLSADRLKINRLG